jgi:hypothetical protein
VEGGGWKVEGDHTFSQWLKTSSVRGMSTDNSWRFFRLGSIMRASAEISSPTRSRHSIEGEVLMMCI